MDNLDNGAALSVIVIENVLLSSLPKLAISQDFDLVATNSLHSFKQCGSRVTLSRGVAQPG